MVDGVLRPPLPVSKYEYNRLAEFRRLLLKRIPPMKVLSQSEFVDMYIGRKKAVYQQACEDFTYEGLKPKHSHLHGFIKFEKVDLRKPPRVISPRDPIYNLELGRYLKHLEKVIYRKIDKVFGDKHVVIKGMNSVDAAAALADKWNSFTDPIAIGLDATKLDMHFRVPALKWEHSVYNSIYRSKKLARLLKRQLKNKGKVYCRDGSFTFMIDGSRSSGDMNTALGNTLVVCALVWTFFKENGIKAKLANNGDDCQVFCERSEWVKFSCLSEWFTPFGFRMKVEKPVSVFERVLFCQTQPVFDGVQYRMVREPSTCFKKDPICVIQVGNALYGKWLASVGQCGQSLCTGIPVMFEFYSAFVRNGTVFSEKVLYQTFNGSGRLTAAKGLVREDRAVTDASRLSYFKAFKIPPDVQRAQELYLSQVRFTFDIPNMIRYTEKIDLITKPFIVETILNYGEKELDC